MKGLRCRLGLHDFYAAFYPLILRAKDTQKEQYMTVKRICLRANCKHREEYIVKLTGKLQDWDVLLSASNFLSEEIIKDDKDAD